MDHLEIVLVTFELRSKEFKEFLGQFLLVSQGEIQQIQSIADTLDTGVDPFGEIGVTLGQKCSKVNPLAHPYTACNHLFGAYAIEDHFKNQHPLADRVVSIGFDCGMFQTRNRRMDNGIEIRYGLLYTIRKSMKLIKRIRMGRHEPFSKRSR